MKRIFLSNIWWKLLSLLLAFLLWIVVAREPELATSISVPILFRNVPQDMEIASDVPDRVNLEIRGPSSRLTQTSLSQAGVVLNLQDLRPGERTFTIHQTNVRGLPMGVTFYRAVPSQVSMRFEHLVTKAVPVEPAYEKGPPAGYAVVNYWFEPKDVTVRGPEERVQIMDHVATDPIDLSGVIGSTVIQEHVQVLDPQIRLDSMAHVTFHVVIQKLPNKETK